MCIKRIVAFTGIRSDYDLMSGIYKKINEDDELELKLIVSGAHMSDTYGSTYKNIEKDNINILAKIESLIDGNSRVSRLKSLAILLQDCITSIANYNPDIIMYAGDREDVIVGGIVGAYLRIPTIHFFGGDHSSDGNVDNAVRHATSKLSSIHFVSHEDHLKRLINLGEESKRIFNVGSPALDKFIETAKMEKIELLNEFKLYNWNEFVVVIYHPIIGEENVAAENFQRILDALNEKKLKAFVSYPNVDSGSKGIIDIILRYQDNENFYFYKNLDRTIFVNLLRNANFLIGNSSLGLFEAPIIKLPVINVGNRQLGRKATDNVIFIEDSKELIEKAIDKVQSNEFIDSMKNIESLFGDGKSVSKVVKILKEMNLDEFLLKTHDPLDYREVL